MATSTLKILREVNDYTQEFVAEDVLGISQNTYSRLEANPSKITAEQAQKLSDLYKVSIANLLSEATPIITFKDSIKENTTGNGYVQTSNHFHEGELNILKEQNALLMKQNNDLMQMIKMLGGKLMANNENQ
jgi:transcriptional regulator with XRE-family HTH domain